MSLSASVQSAQGGTRGHSRAQEGTRGYERAPEAREGTGGRGLNGPLGRGDRSQAQPMFRATGAKKTFERRRCRNEARKARARSGVAKLWTVLLLAHDLVPPGPPQVGLKMAWRCRRPRRWGGSRHSGRTTHQCGNTSISLWACLCHANKQERLLSDP